MGISAFSGWMNGVRSLAFPVILGGHLTGSFIGFAVVNVVIALLDVPQPALRLAV